MHTDVPASPAQAEPGPHRTRQRCFDPVCDRPSASRPVSSSQNRLQAPCCLEAVLTGRNRPGRARTVTNRAETALTGAVRTGPEVTRADWRGPPRRRLPLSVGSGAWKAACPCLSDQRSGAAAPPARGGLVRDARTRVDTRPVCVVWGPCLPWQWAGSRLG